MPHSTMFNHSNHALDSICFATLQKCEAQSSGPIEACGTFAGLPFEFPPLLQVLAWMQPSLTEGFLKAAFHKLTWKSQPELIEQERRHSNANPPHMFKAFHRQVQSCLAASQAPQKQCTEGYRA